MRFPRLPWGRSPARPRVCLVRANNNYDEMQQREADALARAGYDVEVLIVRRGTGERRTEIEHGVAVTGLPARLRREGLVSYAIDYAWFMLLVAGTLTARHLRRPYAVVQVSSMPDFLVLAAVGPKLLGSRIVVFMREPTPELFETIYGRPGLTRALERAEQLAIGFADRTLTVTDDLRQVYIERGARPEKITVIRTANPAPPELLNGSLPARPERRDEFVVICHGSIEDRWGLDTIVEAADLLRESLPGLSVVITGRGGGVDALVQQIESLGLGDIVRFEGWVTRDRLNELLATSDAGIVAQKSSAYSNLVTTNKMVDYWLFGLPTIASRLKSVSGLYDDSVIEYFEPGDAASLAAAITRLHDDPERRHQLVLAGRAALETNGWEAQETRYLEVFDELVRSYDPIPGA